MSSNRPRRPRPTKSSGKRPGKKAKAKAKRPWYELNPIVGGILLVLVIIGGIVTFMMLKPMTLPEARKHLTTLTQEKIDLMNEMGTAAESAKDVASAKTAAATFDGLVDDYAAVEKELSDLMNERNFQAVDLFDAEKPLSNEKKTAFYKVIDALSAIRKQADLKAEFNASVLKFRDAITDESQRTDTTLTEWDRAERPKQPSSGVNRPQPGYDHGDHDG